MKALKYLFTVLFISALLLSCTEEEIHSENQDEHVCEHLLYGPAKDLQSSESAAEALAALQSDPSALLQYFEHTRYDISLHCDSSGCSGWIPYIPMGVSGQDGDYVLYSDAPVAVTIYLSNDLSTAIPLEMSTDHSDDCDAVSLKSVYELEAGQTYLLRLQSEDSVPALVFPALIESDDDDHDH